MKRNRYPSSLILGGIIIHTPHLAFARRVEEIAKVEFAGRGIHSGVANVDGLRINWTVLSALKMGQQ